MATIDDFGGTTDPLNQPPLGGPSGWAAAVRDYIKNLPSDIAGKVSKSGDTMTGALIMSSYPLLFERSGVPRRGFGNFTDGLAAVNEAQNALVPLRVASPTAADMATTKEYVDAIAGAGTKIVSGTAVLSGGSPLTWAVPGLTTLSAFYGINGDVNANSGQIVAFNPAGGNVANLHHTFNGGPFRIYYIAVGT